MIAPSLRTTSFLGFCKTQTLLFVTPRPPLKVYIIRTFDDYRSQQLLQQSDLEILQGIISIEDMKELFRYKTLDTIEARSSLSKKPFKNVLRVSLYTCSVLLETQYV